MAKMTQEQKKAYAKKKADELKAKTEEFKKFTNSLDLKEIMDTITTKGHKYSVYNRMWLAWQIYLRKEKKIEWVFKGYKQWQEEDKFQVLKGQKSFQILAPIIKKVPKKDGDGNIIRDETGEIVMEKKCVAFRQVNVFDISQTDGLEKYLEEKAKIDEKVYGTDNPITLEAVQELVTKQNYGDLTIQYVTEGVTGGRGDFNPLTKTIRVQDGDGHTLIHEVGHYLLWKKGEKYAEGEIKAELIAFHVTKKLGGSWNYTYSNIWNSRLNNGEGISFDRFCKLYEKAEKLVEEMFSK